MDPSFPNDSKAGQLGLKTCVSTRINLAALLQVSKLSLANGGVRHSHSQSWDRRLSGSSSSSRKSQSIRLEHNTLDPVAASCTYASAINASKISSVFVVYRCKTLTGSPDPTHAIGTDKPCIIGGESSL